MRLPKLEDELQNVVVRVRTLTQMKATGSAIHVGGELMAESNRTGV
jgi:hypothetical protein